MKSIIPDFAASYHIDKSEPKYLELVQAFFILFFFHFFIMYLRIANNKVNGRTYLSIVENYYDKLAKNYPQKQYNL
jgi:hypothetical protein